MTDLTTQLHDTERELCISRENEARHAEAEEKLARELQEKERDLLCLRDRERDVEVRLQELARKLGGNEQDVDSVEALVRRKDHECEEKVKAALLSEGKEYRRLLDVQYRQKIEQALQENDRDWQTRLEEAVKDKETELREQERELRNKQVKLREKEDELKDKEAELRDKEVELRDKEAELRDKEAELELAVSKQRMHVGVSGVKGISEQILEDCNHDLEPKNIQRESEAKNHQEVRGSHVVEGSMSYADEGNMLAETEYRKELQAMSERYEQRIRSILEEREREPSVVGGSYAAKIAALEVKY